MFKYITVQDIKSKNIKYKFKAINHISNFPSFHYAPMTQNGTIYLIGGYSNNTQFETCW